MHRDLARTRQLNILSPQKPPGATQTCAHMPCLPCLPRHPNLPPSARRSSTTPQHDALKCMWRVCVCRAQSLWGPKTTPPQARACKAVRGAGACRPKGEASLTRHCGSGRWCPGQASPAASPCATLQCWPSPSGARAAGPATAAVC